MSRIFKAVHPIRFSHCDPGGIVYFPHFFDFISATVEDWSDEAIETPFETHLLRKRLGLPVVSTQCSFFRPTHIGDRLEMELAIARLGSSTIDFLITGRAGGEERLRARHVISMVSLETYRPVPLPDPLREEVTPYVVDLPRVPHLEPCPRPANAFRSVHLLRFSHCDPAGILYFPNTFDMINATVEDWFAKALHLPFEELHIRNRQGFPIVDTRCEFLKPSRIGEDLSIELSISRLGRTSVTLRVSAIVAGEERMRARHVIALVSLDTMRALPIPEELHQRMAAFVAPEPAHA
jgi:4-hydroxybenzoyl-CoA thioesterase